MKNITVLSLVFNFVLVFFGMYFYLKKKKKKTVDKLIGSFYEPAENCQIRELADLYEIYLGKRREGFFVEVGAYDGLSWSNSSCLAKVGWAGLLIEPVPHFAQKCRDLYSNNNKIRIVEGAAGSEESTITLCVADALTTTSAKMVGVYKNIAWSKESINQSVEIRVKQRRLDDILNDASVPVAFEVLIIDVEGAESAVLSGFSLEKWKPKMVIVELAHTHPDLYLESAGDLDIQISIEKSGYSVAYKDSINTVFVRLEPSPSGLAM